MDPSEISKVVPEIGKALTPVVAAIPFTGIVKRMLGPAADEVAEMWRDKVRLYRYSRQLKCVEKAEKMAISAGFTPKAVSPKILFPLLEGASMEEDENLHDMWAALLANASTDWSAQVRPSFIRLLQDMAPDEAKLMQDFTDGEIDLSMLRKGLHGQRFPTLTDLKNAESDLRRKEVAISAEIKKRFAAFAHEDKQATERRFDACIQSLESVRLIVKNSSPEGTRWELSERGVLFMNACRPPKREELKGADRGKE